MKIVANLELVLEAESATALRKPIQKQEKRTVEQRLPASFGGSELMLAETLLVLVSPETSDCGPVVANVR